jgi:ubiquinone/menaquinone biosynthesis C-methylase UbiE
MAYGEGLRRLNPLPDAFLAETLRRVVPAAETLLDLACGRGDRLRFLADAFPALRLAGLDADGENARRAAAACPAAQIRCGDAAALPYPGAAFDVLLCECSFSLFADPARCAGEIARVLRPGGTLLLGDLVARADARADVCLADEGTVRRVYGSGTLEAFLTAAGLTPAERIDRSGDLTQMLGQMLFDGTLCACLSQEALRRMREIKTGYMLWIFRA